MSEMTLEALALMPALAQYEYWCEEYAATKQSGIITYPVDGGWREIQFQDGVDVGGGFFPSDYESDDLLADVEMDEEPAAEVFRVWISKDAEGSFVWRDYPHWDADLDLFYGDEAIEIPARVTRNWPVGICQKFDITAAMVQSVDVLGALS